MRISFARLSPAALLAIAAVLYAAEKPKPAPSPVPVDPYTEVQPATESLDMGMYQRIRDEGLNHSHVMEFASALMDGIGPRLTGSPNAKKANEWTRDTLTKIGLENAHLEDWGEFGLGWQQVNTWARMVTPDAAVLILQSTPWSPATPGPITGDVVFVNIQTDKDFDQYKGKLAGKIHYVLAGYYTKLSRGHSNLAHCPQRNLKIRGELVCDSGNRYFWIHVYF